jgi:Tol biopolymer transport system component
MSTRLVTATTLSLLAACGGSDVTLPRLPFPIQTVAPFGQIAFVSNRDGSPYIYVDSAGDPKVRRLTRGENPAWSPDGAQIAFNDVPSGSDQPAIHIINVDGSGEHVLPLKGSAPTWSPGGTKLAFATPLGLYVANVDGSSLTGLVANDFLESGDVLSDPSWSPDGKSIAFVRANEDDAPAHVYIVRFDGSTPRPLDDLQLSEKRPRWSLDGLSIAFQSDVLTGSLIVTEAIDGSDVRTRAAGPWPFRDADWSGDGVNVSFSKPAVGSSLRIFVTDTRTGETRRLIADAAAPLSGAYDDYQGAWSRAMSWDYY